MRLALFTTLVGVKSRVMGGDSPVLVFGADLPGCPGRGDVVLGAVSSAGSGFCPAVPGCQPLIIYRGLRGI